MWLYSARASIRSRNISTINNWNESQVIIDRRSKFQARHVKLYDSADIPKVLDQFISQHKNIAKSSSHPYMLAWRTGDVLEFKEGNSQNCPTYHNVKQGFKDCGEKGAGSRILNVLVSQNVMNRLVIVTRWFGGSHLGPSRFRHIAYCTAESLRKGSADNTTVS